MAEMSRISILRFPAKAYQLKEIRFVVQQAMKQIGCEEHETDDIVLAINEACMNIIQHGYGDNDDISTEKKCAEIILEIFEDRHQVLFRITDFAKSVDIGSMKARDLKDIRPGGLGIHFIHEIMDSVESKSGEAGKGNILELRKSIQCRS